jgi:hypothetical protein
MQDLVVLAFAFGALLPVLELLPAVAVGVVAGGRELQVQRLGAGDAGASCSARLS